jgi:CHAT domain-containing protein/tetratricopeptide (TPR) repeat protein
MPTRAEAVAAVERARRGAPDELTRSLEDLAELDLEHGRIEPAMESARELIDRLEALVDEGDLLPARWASQFGARLERARAFEAAEELYRRAITGYERVGDRKNAAALRNNIGLARFRAGAFAEAAVALEEAVDAYAALGPDFDQNVARALGSLLKVYEQAANETARATTLSRLADLAERLAWPTLPVILRDLCQAYLDVSDHPAALATADRLVLLAERTLAPGHVNAATARGTRAVVLRAMADERGAEREQRAALSVLQEKLGFEAAPTRATASNLASLLRDQGRYAEASELLDRCLRAARDAPDIGASELEVLLTNHAEIARLTGNAAAAVDGFREALKVAKEAYGDDSPELVQNISNLAAALKDAGRTQEAYAQLASIEKLAPQRPGTRNPKFLMAMLNAASIAIDAGELAQAQQTLVLADATAFQMFGDHHPMMADVKVALADIAQRRGKPKHARGAARMALKILDGTRPGANETRGEALAILAEASAMLGESDALDSAIACQRTYDALLGQVFATASEQQRVAFAGQVRESFESFLAVLVAQPPDQQRAAQGLLGVLRRKGLGVEAFAVQREALLSQRYPELAPRLAALRELRFRAVNARAGAPADAQRMAALEVELARAIPEMNIERRLATIEVADVAAALPPDSCLVEIVRTALTALDQPFADGVRRRSERYLAFVLHRGGDVQFVDLCPAEPIDEMISLFRASVDSGGGRDLDLDEPRATGDVSALERLAQVVWAPLSEHVRDARHVLLAPDGALSLVPFEALPGNAGTPLIEQREVSYLLSGRDLLRLDEPFSPAGQPCVVGGCDYGSEPDKGPFLPLPGSAIEAGGVARLLGVEPITGRDASKSVVVDLRSPQILHLATHGFALPYTPTKLDAGTPTESLAARFGNQQNPMLRAGLAFAGGNEIEANGEASARGVLTAYELAELDLRGTRLAVLSACQTGTGEVSVNEGVYGLRRAIAVAGARTQVVSLWRVPDWATQRLMTLFYEAIVQGAGCSAALTGAKQALRAEGAPLAAWAGFVCFGDPGPIRA